jgi:hypothetical protein
MAGKNCALNGVFLGEVHAKSEEKELRRKIQS